MSEKSILYISCSLGDQTRTEHTWNMPCM